MFDTFNDLAGAIPETVQRYLLYTIIAVILWMCLRRFWTRTRGRRRGRLWRARRPPARQFVDKIARKSARSFARNPDRSPFWSLGIIGAIAVIAVLVFNGARFGAPGLTGSKFSGAVGGNISGHTYVIDGDTIDVGGRRVRLNGIAAPEMSERGGAAAKAVMSRLVAGGAVTCQQVDTDRYGRAVGICSVNGRDIGAAMVASGTARDCPRYSGGRYHSHETDASRRLPLPGYCRR